MANSILSNISFNYLAKVRWETVKKDPIKKRISWLVLQFAAPYWRIYKQISNILKKYERFSVKLMGRYATILKFNVIFAKSKSYST